MRLLLAILSIVLWAGTPARSQTSAIAQDQPDVNPQYFPKGMLRDSRYSDFMTRNYAKALRTIEMTGRTKGTTRLAVSWCR